MIIIILQCPDVRRPGVRQTVETTILMIITITMTIIVMILMIIQTIKTNNTQEQPQCYHIIHDTAYIYIYIDMHTCT